MRRVFSHYVTRAESPDDGWMSSIASSLAKQTVEHNEDYVRAGNMMTIAPNVTKCREALRTALAEVGAPLNWKE